MRIRHFLFMAVPVVVATIGVLAVTLYHPLVGGRRQLSLSQLITAPAAGAVQRPAGAEKTIEQTDPPAVAALARRYQPTVVAGRGPALPAEPGRERVRSLVAENFGIACNVAPGTPKPAPQL